MYPGGVSGVPSTLGGHRTTQQAPAGCLAVDEVHVPSTVRLSMGPQQTLRWLRHRL